MQAPDTHSASPDSLVRGGVADELVGPRRRGPQPVQEERLRVGGPVAREAAAAVRELEAPAPGSAGRPARTRDAPRAPRSARPSVAASIARVRVEEEQVRRRAGRGAEVAAVGEAAVARGADQVAQGGRRSRPGCRRARRCRRRSRATCGDARASGSTQPRRVVAAAVGDDDGVDGGAAGTARPYRTAVPPTPSRLGRFTRARVAQDWLHALDRRSTSPSPPPWRSPRCSPSAARSSGAPRWSPDGLFYQARVYELQGIDRDDALAEGVPGPAGRRAPPRRPDALGRPGLGQLQRPVLRAPPDRAAGGLRDRAVGRRPGGARRRPSPATSLPVLALFWLLRLRFRLP